MAAATPFHSSWEMAQISDQPSEPRSAPNFLAAVTCFLTGPLEFAGDPVPHQELSRGSSDIDSAPHFRPIQSFSRQIFTDSPCLTTPSDVKPSIPRIVHTLCVVDFVPLGEGVPPKKRSTLAEISFGLLPPSSLVVLLLSIINGSLIRAAIHLPGR